MKSHINQLIEEMNSTKENQEIYVKKTDFFHSNDKLLKYYLNKDRKSQNNDSVLKNDNAKITELLQKIKLLQKYESEYEKIKRQHYLVKQELRALKTHNQENIKLIDNFKVLLNQKNSALKIESAQEQDKLSKKLKLKSLQIAHLKKFNFFLSQWNAWASTQLDKYRQQTESTKFDLEKLYEKLDLEYDERFHNQFQKTQLHSEVIKLRGVIKEKEDKCLKNERLYLQCQKEFAKQFRQVHAQIKNLQLSFNNILQKIQTNNKEIINMNMVAKQQMKLLQIDEQIMDFDERFNMVQKLKIKEQRSSYESYILLNKFNDYESKIKKYEQQNVFIDRKNKELQSTLAKNQLINQQIQTYKQKYQMEFYQLSSLIQKKRNEFKNILCMCQRAENPFGFTSNCLKCSQLQTLFIESITLLTQECQKINKSIQEVFTFSIK